MIILILLLSFVVVTMALGFYFDAKDRGVGAAAIFTLGISVFIIFIIISIVYYSSGKKAATLNKMFGTHYTRDDLFFSEKMIMSIIEGEKYRIIFEENKKRNNPIRRTNKEE